MNDLLHAIQIAIADELDEQNATIDTARQYIEMITGDRATMETAIRKGLRDYEAKVYLIGDTKK